MGRIGEDPSVWNDGDMRIHPALLVVLCLPLPGSLAQVVHKRPSSRAATASLDLPWETRLEKALVLAAESKRPILWYPPTVPASPMDRQPELDLYMRAGMFSDPGLRVLFQHYVLLKHVPTRKEAKTFRLRPFQFIEPGFLILDGKGKVLDRCSGMSSFPRPWLEKRFASHLDPRIVQRIQQRTKGAVARARLEQFAAGRFHLKGMEDAPDAWNVFLDASALFEQGKKGEARQAWSALAKRQGDSPLAAWALAEAEGLGPIVRGFWSWTDPREGAPLLLAGTTLPATSKELPGLLRSAIRYLIRMQEDNGGFEDSTYDFGGQDSVPNVHVAVTALAAMALFRHRSEVRNDWQQALEKAIDYVLDPAHRNPVDKDEWTWARLYPLHLYRQILTAEKRLGWPRKALRERIRKEAALCAGDLLARQTSSGAFRHEYSNPFVTASVLLALKDGRSLGIPVEEARLDRALTSLEKARTKLGAFSYMQPRGKARASLVAAAGRMPLCEAALFAYGRSSKERLVNALRVSFEHHEQLESTRKYDDHANRNAYGGFFYWYDQLGRAMAMDLLGSQAARFRTLQREQVLAIPEIDGSFVDSHELGKSYGTAMALLCLEPQTRPARKAPKKRDQGK